MQVIALVDCNNFYVSCERLFRPDLWQQPVAVLSNNDGCIVARSQEVKRLGIKMATPVYQVQHLIKRHHIRLFSSNYPFYADMSDRVNLCLESFTPHIEWYSIDESFLDLSGISPHPTAYGRQIKKTVYRHTGLPVSVGIGPTKTLAKLANFAAKKWPKTGGVVNVSAPETRRKLLNNVAVEEVWGIGRRTARRLQLMGITSAGALARQPVELMHAQFNVVVARTVMELNGIACLSLEDIPDKQQIVCSRSFKQRLTRYEDLAQALTVFCNRAAKKLRSQQSVTGSISVFIGTNPSSEHDVQYQRSCCTVLDSATNDTRHIIKAAKTLLANIFQTGYRYNKCRVTLGHIRPALPPGQGDLFDLVNLQQSTALMETVDRINQRFPNTIAVSGAHINNRWETPVDYLSQGFTTRWNELANVKCC